MQAKEAPFEQMVNIALARKGWQRKDLAEEMGVSKAYLTDILKERRTPAERIEQIETILKDVWGE